jgi:hypothetical protein
MVRSALTIKLVMLVLALAALAMALGGDPWGPT